MNEVTESNGYPIIHKEPISSDDGWFRIMVQRPKERCPFPEAPYVVAVKDFNQLDYDGWAYAVSYDLSFEAAVELLNKKG